jgi:signal transduction histidine kinase
MDNKEKIINGLQAEIERLRGELEKSKEREQNLEDTRRAMLYMLEDLNKRTEDIQNARKSLESALENLKKSQNMLIRSEKLAALGQLSAGVAHEIKNPLNIISTCVQLMMMDENISGENMEAYKTIMEQIARAAKITENLRDFARERKPEIKDIDLHGFLEKTIALVEYELKLDNISFARDFHPSPVYVKGDADQLAQVFLNLINNAADSMKEKQRKAGREQLRESGWEGNLTISTSHDGERVFINFKDRGTGIPQETQKRVFDPFFTTKGEGKGTGLGLSIAMGIIENHGGTMLLESVEGEGATFAIKLPYYRGGA